MEKLLKKSLLWHCQTNILKIYMFWLVEQCWEKKQSCCLIWSKMDVFNLLNQYLIPVFLPGESQGRGSLVGCCLWGHTELDMTEAMQQQQQRHSLEKAMTPHSSTLAWKIPWTEEPGGQQSMGLLRVRHDWVTSLSLFTFMHWRRKWQPTPVLLHGESQGWESLVGCCLWGHTESDTTEAT